MSAKLHRSFLALVALLGVSGCMSEPPDALGPTPAGKGPSVRFDVFHQPFAEIPLPNDFATREDASSPTGRRLNASVAVGTTRWERATRRELDALSGWGTLAPISVSFDAPIDVEPIYARHRRDNLDFSDDVVLVLDVTAGSPGRCEAIPLDLGQGNWPQVLAQTSLFEADPRDGLQTLVFEEVEEDLNANGVLDPGEDTDMDGVLDHPNTRDGRPGSELMDFYERESRSLILKPIMPMREGTTYAVVLTRRLASPDGEPVRSPFDGINHAGQTQALRELPSCLGRHGLTLEDVAFTWSFTTQNLTQDYRDVRDGLYERGRLSALGKQFPAELATLADVRAPTPGAAGTKLVKMDQFVPMALKLLSLTGSSDEEKSIFQATMQNVDFLVAGAIRSPQLFPREDASGHRLPLYEQVWDLEAPPRPEDVQFWMFVPKQRRGPAPVAMFIHGHGGSMFEALPFAGLFASYGIATLGINGPSHGVGLPATQIELVRGMFKDAGLAGLGSALLDGRALDWTADGNVDSGDDFWSAYVFHTRDMVRQTMVDSMQVLRTLRSFDGQRRWSFDPAGAGSPGLAGDFDGDGQVDVGGSAPLNVIGGSLGGITGGLLAGIEPALEVGVVIVPGGNLSEIGTRSTLSGIRDAMVLRTLGPLFFAEGGALKVRVNSGQTSDVALRVHELPTLASGDTVVLTNAMTGEWRCAVVQPSGSFRVTVPSDEGDKLALRVYPGGALPREREGCEVPKAPPYVEISSFGEEVTLDGRLYEAGTPLVAVTDGFGQRRATPDLRRFLGLSQIALDAADPANFAPYWDGTRSFTYATGETPRTSVLVMPSNGDPGVAVAAGIGLARAAGFVGWSRDDPRYGKSQNQVLLDTHTIEGTSRLGHYHNGQGEPVLMDVEDFASVVGADDGFDVPHLNPPLRLVQRRADGTHAGLLIPMISAKGKHGFVSPEPSRPFDQGTYLLNILGRYVASGARELSFDGCQVTSSCPWPTFPLQ